MVREEVVVDVEVDFGTDEDGGEGGVPVGEEVECEDYAAVGAVLEGDDAEGGGA